MPINPHQAAINAALRTNGELAVLFGRMGTSAHPRGLILSAYRNARPALQEALQSEGAARQRGVQDTLFLFRGSVAAAVDELLKQAVKVGMLQARNEAKAYGLSLPAEDPFIDLSARRAAFLGPLDAQSAAISALAGGGADEELIFGDDDHAGLFTPGPVVRDGSRWLTDAALAGWRALILPAIVTRETQWYKQAIAAIDHLTTPCCLRVTGQAVPMDDKFTTTEPPAWALHQDWMPFHWWCRTAGALVPKEYANDDLTKELIEAGRAEWAARASTGQREVIWPSHGRSRR